MNTAAPAARPGRQALEHLDKVLAERPEKNGHEISAVMRCLGEFRDGIVAVRRDDPDHAAVALLETVNGVISSVLAAQFPLGEIQWEEVEKARGWLADLVESEHLR